MPAPKKGVADYIAKKIAKKAVTKVKPKPNTKAMPKSNVKKVAKKTTTAPKTGLENRGKKLTRAQRSERASDYYFDKAESRWEGEYLTASWTGLKGPKEKGIRGQGASSRRKTEAVRKEAKPVVKINSQQNLKKKSK